MWIILDTQLEHRESCSTAEATRGHYACVHVFFQGLRLADPGITTEPRGLDSQTHNQDGPIFSPPLLSQDAAWLLDVCLASSTAAAARGDAAQAAFLIAKPHTTREKSRAYKLEASSVVHWLGQQIVGHTLQSPEPYSTQLTLHHVATDSKCP